MASPTTLPPPRNPAFPDRGAPTVLPGAGRQRRWSLALLAVLVTVGSALAFVLLWMNAGGRRPVLALARDVPAGQPIRAEDLRVVRVSTDPGIAPVASSARDQVVGRPAAVDLLAGTLLVKGAVGHDQGLDTGTLLIGVPVPRVQVPSSDLARGDNVMIYRTGGSGSDATPQTIGPGRVFDVDTGKDDSSDDIRVSVVIDADLAPDVAAAIETDQLYLAKTSGQG